MREPTERPDRRTPRDELPGPYRAVSDVLDDYLMREYGRITSHNGWDLFLDLLVEQGYEVRALAARAENSSEEKGGGPATLYDAVLSALNALADDLPGEPPVILAWDPAILAGRVTDLVEKSGLSAAPAENAAGDVTAVRTELARVREQRDRALDFADAQVRELERSTAAGGAMDLARRRTEVDRLRRLAATPPVQGRAETEARWRNSPQRDVLHDLIVDASDTVAGGPVAGATADAIALAVLTRYGAPAETETEARSAPFLWWSPSLAAEHGTVRNGLLMRDDGEGTPAARPWLAHESMGWRRCADLPADAVRLAPAPAGPQAEGAGETAGGER